MQLVVLETKKKENHLQSSCYDSVLPLLGAQVLPLDGELRSHKPCSTGQKLSNYLKSKQHIGTSPVVQ